MATITVNIPDAQLTRVLEALSKAYGWNTSDGPKPAFVRSAVAKQIETMVLQVERSEAEMASMVEKDTLIDPGIS